MLSGRGVQHSAEVEIEDECAEFSQNKPEGLGSDQKNADLAGLRSTEPGGGERFIRKRV